MFSYKNNNLLPLLNTSSRRTDNASVILFTNARDEPNISEWIAHHLLLGFDKVIVFDHLSSIPISSSVPTNFNQNDLKKIFDKNLAEHFFSEINNLY